MEFIVNRGVEHNGLRLDEGDVYEVQKYLLALNLK
jgi:hypothetical protein